MSKHTGYIIFTSKAKWDNFQLTQEHVGLICWSQSTCVQTAWGPPSTPPGTSLWINTGSCNSKCPSLCLLLSSACSSAGATPSTTALVSPLQVFCSKVTQEVSSNASSSLVEKKHQDPHALRTSCLENNPPLSLLFLLLNAHTSLVGPKAKALKRKGKKDISLPQGMKQWKTIGAAGLWSWSIHYYCGWWHYSSCSPLGISCTRAMDVPWHCSLSLMK